MITWDSWNRSRLLSRMFDFSAKKKFAFSSTVLPYFTIS